jgi:tetratricopeptide (TPR) repeat protein
LSVEAVETQGLLHQALDAQQSGDQPQAERLYLTVLAREPRDFNANHLLGVLRFQQGRAAEALRLFDTALTVNPVAPEALAHRGLVLHALGLSGEALTSLDRALALKPDQAEALNWRGMVLQALRRPADALESLEAVLTLNPGHAEALSNRAMALKALDRVAEALASLEKAAAIEPGNLAIQFNLGLLLRELGCCEEAATALRMVVAGAPDHVAAINNLGLVLCECGLAGEAMAHFRHQAELAWASGGAADSTMPDHQRRHDQEQREYLAAQGIKSGGLHIGSGERLNGPAVNQAGTDTIARWQSARPQIVVIDNLLTEEALAALRRFCMDSTIWRKPYANGYLGAIPESGFASPLLAQIADELRQAYEGIFGQHPLRYLWAFKCDSRQKGVNIHADFAAVNVNFWITPDEANLDAAHGGLMVWDVAAPLDWDFNRYNNDEAAIRGFLAEKGAGSVTVPYRANRAVIFDSDLFHETDAIAFRDGYANRRINITMLYGRRRTHEGLAPAAQRGRQGQEGS